MEGKTEKARCVSCRSEVEVPAGYADGDHIKCGTCGTQHRILRGDTLRLVLADVGPLRDQLQANRQRTSQLESELRTARGSIGIGVNGFGLGVAFILFEVGIEQEQLSTHLFWDAAGVALASGIVLELLNYFFLAKRRTMRRLSTEIDELRDEDRQLRQKIRDATRR